MNFNKKCKQVVLVLTSISLFSSAHVKAQTNTPLTLAEAIAMAQKIDPWLDKSQSKEAQLAAMAVSAGELPDPQMSLGIANLGADNFDFNQEAMTQLKIGLSQKFPRGKSRSIQKDQLNIQAGQQVWLRTNRTAQVVMETSQLWLQAYRAQESIRLIKRNRSLFDQLVDWVDASYSSGYGQARQQDLIQAQLEVTRLEDRLTQLEQGAEFALNQLQQYIGPELSTLQIGGMANLKHDSIIIASQFPEIKPVSSYITSQSDESITAADTLPNQPQEPSNWLNTLQKHPAIMALNVEIDAAERGVNLAQQKYKPAWGLNASYGYRAEGDNQMRRADLLTVGVTFDLPLFTNNRQDQGVKAAIANVDALESEKLLMLRQLNASFKAETSKLQRLQQRHELFVQSLLPQMSQQAEVILNAYTNDDGDFADVIRARITELNALIDALSIKVDIAMTQVKLNYLLSGAMSAQINQEIKGE